MTNTQKLALDITKDIVVAKLNSATASTANGIAGKEAGEMFQAVYNVVYPICLAEDSK